MPKIVNFVVMQSKSANITRIFSAIGMLCLFFNLGLNAQKVTISPEILLRDDYSYALLGKVDDKVLLVRNKGFTQTLSIYNEGLGFVQEVPMEFEDKRVSVIGFVTNKNDFNIYYSFKSGTKEIIKAVKLSSSGEKYYQDTVAINDNVFLTQYYKFHGSENDRYICLFNVEDENTMQLMFYDNQEMKLLFNQKIDVEGVSMRKDFRNITISNKGEIALLFDKNNTLYRKELHYYRLLIMNKEGKVRDQKLKIPDVISVDQKLIADDENNRFKIVGLYSDKYENISNGYFVGDEQNDIKLVPFPEKMIARTNTKSKKRYVGLEDYGLNDVIFRKDGGCLMVLESNKEFVRANSTARGGRAGSYRIGVTDYYNEDILVLSMYPNGAFHWNAVLPKKQFSQDDDGIYSSFFIFKTPAKLHFVYNDEIKSNNTVSEYVLNPAGVFERNAVLSTAYQKLKLRIRSSIQISNNAFLLTSERNNRLNIVKIEY